MNLDAGGANPMPQSSEIDSPQVVAQVLAAVRGTSLTDLDVEWDGGSLHLKRDIAGHSTPSALGDAASAEDQGPTIVRALSVGTFHRDPERGFPEPGETVSERTRLAEVETLGIRNQVLAGVDGVLIEILVDDLTPVEYGQPLAIVRSEIARRG
jgi:biotin carboxyl carrier protein